MNDEELVRQVLEKFPFTRESTKHLLLETWEMQGFRLSQEQKDWFIKYAMESEQCTRRRRDIQATGQYCHAIQNEVLPLPMGEDEK